jgi:uncharacterized protein (TIGR02596 family)
MAPLHQPDSPHFTPRKRTHRTHAAGFSLIELLVVIAIIGIIGTIAVPAVGSLLKGSSLTQAANLLRDQVSLARQHALSKNRVVELRFYRFGDPEQPGEKAEDPSTGFFRGLQFFEIGDGGVPIPVGKVARFPDSMMMHASGGGGSSSLSTLLETDIASRLVTKGALSPNDPELPRGVKRNYDYVAFRFLPDGSTNLPPTGTKWFITVHAASDLPKATGGQPPPNFFTWMIDPVSGTSKVFRPGTK